MYIVAAVLYYYLIDTEFSVCVCVCVWAENLALYSQADVGR